MESQSELKLSRFCGEELYPITAATWEVFEDDDEPCELWLEIEAGRGTQLHDDTNDLDAEPHWELTFVSDSLRPDSLVAGFTAEIPLGEEGEGDDSTALLYYCEHEPTDKNSIEVLAVDGDRLLLRVTGETMDVNFYDGSKPNTKLFVETWFTPR
jgi:hypothetical protein